MIGIIIDFALGNLPVLLGGLAAIFGIGWVYRKGRIASREKSDKELQDALDDTKAVAARARAAGKRARGADLRSDDGNKRIK